MGAEVLRHCHSRMNPSRPLGQASENRDTLAWFGAVQNRTEPRLAAVDVAVERVRIQYDDHSPIMRIESGQAQYREGGQGTARRAVILMLCTWRLS